MELPVDTLVADLEVSQEPVYQVERILKWQKAQGSRRGKKQVLVTGTGDPLEEAQWIPQENFTDQKGFQKLMKQDCPIEETSKRLPSTSASLVARV